MAADPSDARARWSQFRSGDTVLMPLRACLSLLALAALLPASSARAAVKVRRGVVYGHAQVAAGSAPLVLDLYRPARRTSTRARSRHVRTEYHRIAGGVHDYAGARFFTEAVHGQETSFERLLRFARTALR